MVRVYLGSVFVLLAHAGAPFLINISFALVVVLVQSIFDILSMWSPLIWLCVFVH